MTSSKKQSGKPRKQRKNGVDSTVGEHRCPFGKCTYSADNRGSLEGHIRAAHLRSPSPSKDGTGEGVTSPEPLDIQHLRDELERDKLELDRLRLKKKIDELDDDGQDDPWVEVDKMMARDAMMELQRNRHSPQQPAQSDARVGELEKVIEQLRSKYALSEMQSSFEADMAALRSQIARLQPSRNPGPRAKSANELQSEQNLKMMSEGFGLLSQSLATLSRRVDVVSGKVEKGMDMVMPVARQIAMKKLKASPEEMEEWRDREQSIDDIPLSELQEMDRALREVHGEGYCRDEISEEELAEVHEKAKERLRETKPSKKAVESAQESPSTPKPEKMVLVLKSQRKRKGGK